MDFKIKGLDDFQKGLSELGKTENIEKAVLKEGIPIKCPKCQTAFTTHEISAKCPNCGEISEVEINFK